MVRCTMSLDTKYTALSRLVRSVLGLDLETLASRAPAVGYEYFDLERLLAHVRSSPLALDDKIFGPFSRQVRGYLATIEAYVALGIIKDKPLSSRRSSLRRRWRYRCRTARRCWTR